MKLYLKGLLFILVIIVIASISNGQEITDGNTKVDVEKLKQDFTILRDSLEKIHPALYQFSPKEEINRLFDSCYKAINNMSVMQFFMLCKFMTSAIRDGHMACNPPREIVQNQLANAKVFPLRLWFIGNKAFVYCDKSKQFSAGSEIISFDNHPIEEIKTRLFKYLTSDGKIETKKYWTINSGEAAFNFLYYWLEGEKSNFLVKYKTTDGKIETLLLNARILAQDDCVFEKKIENNYLSLDFKSNNIAALTIKSFDINRLNDDEKFFGHFLDSAFNEIAKQKTTKLIIDLRNNGGGEDSYGAKLYSYLTDKSFVYYKSIERKNYTFPTDAHPNLKIQQPNKASFLGKCYFLINGKSFSTTSEFCAIAKSNERGVFIGEETGGTYYGNTGGEQSLITLPYSKIRLTIPHRKYVLDVRKHEPKNRGIIPDHIIIPGIEDILNNNDVQLKYALELAGL